MEQYAEWRIWNHNLVNTGLGLIRPPQVVERLHSIANPLQRTCSRNKGIDNAAVRHALGAQAEPTSAKDGVWCSDLTCESLPSVIAELILVILDINGLKMRLSFGYGGKEIKQTALGFENENHGEA